VCTLLEETDISTISNLCDEQSSDEDSDSSSNSIEFGISAGEQRQILVCLACKVLTLCTEKGNQRIIAGVSGLLTSDNSLIRSAAMETLNVIVDHNLPRSRPYSGFWGLTCVCHRLPATLSVTHRP